MDSTWKEKVLSTECWHWSVSVRIDVVIPYSSVFVWYCNVKRSALFAVCNTFAVGFNNAFQQALVVLEEDFLRLLREWWEEEAGESESRSESRSESLVLLLLWLLLLLDGDTRKVSKKDGANWKVEKTVVASLMTLSRERERERGLRRRERRKKKEVLVVGVYVLVRTSSLFLP